jgi:GTP cyclohydrolase I
MRTPRSSKRRRVEAAFEALLEALGVAVKGDFARTPGRAASLWLDQLLAGADTEPSRALGRGVASRATAPVCVTHIGVHLVCPHHLTVAFGHAHVAYIPAGRVAGFGNIADLVRACTARFVLQEDASQEIATALHAGLGASATVAHLHALHPCHNALHPRSHDARAVSWGTAGAVGGIKVLQRLILAHLDKERR